MAVDDEKIVGQYSTLRYEAYYFGEKMMASLSFDTGTHPDYRRQGIFKTVGDHHFKEEGKQNIHFSIGFPNENFWPGGKKFGWHALCPIPLLENHNISQLKKIKNSKFEIVEISHFDNEFKEFSERYKDDIPIYLNRTKRYLNWRFVEKPNLKDPKQQYEYFKYKILDKTGELISYIVTKYYQSEDQKYLHLVDFLLPNDNDLYRFILVFLIDKVLNNHFNAISLFLGRYHPFSDFLKKHGFKYAETNRVLIVRANNDVLDKKVLFEEKNHYITMADSDVI